MGVQVGFGQDRPCNDSGRGAPRQRPWLLGAPVLALLAACGLAAAPGAVPGITEQQILAADPGNWLTYNRTYDEQRFSPLDQINADNAAQLGLAWFSDLDTARGQEATPLAIEGVLYTTTAWSMVKAYDGVSGKLLWSFDPQVPRAKLVKACCDAVNRGLAVWGNKLYLGTLDGRLIALDRHTGKVAWTTATVPADSDYTITGAPRAVRGKIIIGNGGAEYSARGFIAAYDAETGKRVWKFYTVPGNPKKPFEQPELARAAKTWSGRYWLQGGGGTVWDGITYDDRTGLLYFGTGNGEPWNTAVRDPGEGDNLFTASIVAVNPDTGKYVWHFQETPQDRWDFDSDAQITVADLSLNGQVRRVLMHAPKNGVFYMLDARTGAFIQGKPYTQVTWTTGLDPKTGKPQVVPEARYDRTGKLFFGMPGAGGAHSWMPQSYSPKTGLLYIPVTEAGFPYLAAKNWQPQPLGFNTGLDGANTAMPAIPAVREAALKGTTGRLVAWDPVNLKEVWSVAHPAAWNGGVLSTGGNLVFQGNARGQFEAYRADTGQKLWSAPTQTGVIAGPMTYRGRDGAQYVAVMAGWGGVWALAPGLVSLKGGATRNVSRLLVFKLGGTAQLPPVDPHKLPLDPPALTGTSQQVAEGAQHYARFCSTCHGDAAISGGVNPDLRHSATLGDTATWQAIVHDGGLSAAGMIGWSRVMKPGQIDAIRHYVIKRANEDKALGM